MPSSVTTIDSYSFYSCISLKSINTDNITMIKNSAFEDCYSLQSINIPNGATSINSFTFNNCSSLQSITLPSSITSIGNNAFEGCSSLQSITLPSSITSIDNSAFSGCQSLQSITLPSSITSIGKSAFEGCSNIRYAKINTIADITRWTYSFHYTDSINTTYDFSEVTAIPTLSSTGGLNSSSYITAIIVPDALYDDWIVATNWSTFASKIKKASEYTYQ